MSFKMIRLGCFANGTDFYSYSVTTRADSDGRVACPMCGKTVKLRATQPGYRRWIPAHYKRRTEESSASSLHAAIAKATGAHLHSRNDQTHE